MRRRFSPKILAGLSLLEAWSKLHVLSGQCWIHRRLVYMFTLWSYIVQDRNRIALVILVRSFKRQLQIFPGGLCVLDVHGQNFENDKSTDEARDNGRIGQVLKSSHTPIFILFTVNGQSSSFAG